MRCASSLITLLTSVYGTVLAVGKSASGRRNSPSNSILLVYFPHSVLVLLRLRMFFCWPKFVNKSITNTLQSSTLSSHVAICTVNPFLHLYLSCIEQRQTAYVSQHTLCIILTWRIDSKTIFSTALQIPYHEDLVHGSTYKRTCLVECNSIKPQVLPS